MGTLLDILVLGSIWGALYALIATGFTLIFGVAGIINLSHGAFYMIGAYLAYTFISVMKMNTPIAILMAVGVTALVGMIIDRFGIRPMRDRHVYVLILTLAFSLFFQEVIYVLYGPRGKSVEPFFDGEVFLGNLHIPHQKVFTFFISAGLVILLFLFLRKTKTGKSISAVAQNKDAAILVGIYDERVYLITAGISAGLAAVAGVFIAPILEAVPTMWVFPMFKAFSIVILGGLGSLGGAIIASLLLGYSETIVSLLISANYTDMVYLAAAVTVLVFRPTGLMSKKKH